VVFLAVVLRMPVEVPLSPTRRDVRKAVDGKQHEPGSSNPVPTGLNDSTKPPRPCETATLIRQQVPPSASSPLGGQESGAGAAMIPCTSIKKVNPDTKEVKPDDMKGSATEATDFLLVA
jgi:hypothetical protein